MKTRIFAFLLACAAPASADIYPFAVYENASGVSTAGLNSVLQVSPGSGGGAELRFLNDSSIAGVITSIYIESSPAAQALLSSPVLLPQMAGVNFTLGASPPNPATSLSNWGGPWQGTYFSMKAAAPAPSNGLSSGEWISLAVSATPQVIQSALESGELRMAQHIQSLGPGGQASVWAVTTAIPAPAAATILLLSAGFTVHRRRR